MIPFERPERIGVAFDDLRLVANAGLLLPITLAHRLGLGELVDSHLDLGNAPGRANAGDNMLTLVASALAGGDLPAQLLLGHMRQLDRVSRELLARAWAAGAGPGNEPLQWSEGYHPLVAVAAATRGLPCREYWEQLSWKSRVMIGNRSGQNSLYVVKELQICKFECPLGGARRRIIG